MKIKSIVIALTLISLSTQVLALTEPDDYSNNSSLKLKDTAKYVVRPQFTVSKPYYDNDKKYYQSTAGDLMFGSQNRNDNYHLGVDIWETPHVNNEGYNSSGDYVTLPIPGILVAKASNDTVLGNALMFLHPNAGRNNKDIYSIFLHNAASNIHNNMVVGSFYGARNISEHRNTIGYVTTIGSIGETGLAGDDGIAHLHYELRYFPEWIKQFAIRNIYALNYTDYLDRVTSNNGGSWYENPQNFALNAVSFSGFSDEFRVNISLNAYYEKYGSGPRSNSDCKTLFERATQEDNRARTIGGSTSKSYSVSYNSGECTYMKVQGNLYQEVIWGNGRSKLILTQYDEKFNADRNGDIDMFE
jgi:hypothetical protein